VSDVLDDVVLKFLESQPVGTITTIRKDGKARSTLVYFRLVGHRVHISTELERGKARDVEASGWASLCVAGHEKPFPSLTLEGSARVLTEDIGESTAAILTKISGNAPETTPTDAQLASAGRVILEIDIDKVYGASYLKA